MSSTACWPWPSPTCCTTTAARDAPALGACSPTWTPPNSAWPTCSTFTATHRPADHAHTGELGNTPTPPAHTVLPAETPSTINEGRKLTLGPPASARTRISLGARAAGDYHLAVGRERSWRQCGRESWASRSAPECPGRGTRSPTSPGFVSATPP